MQAPGAEVGGRFGPYELRSLLGGGGMGEVYEAYDTDKDRVVALKLLAEELARDPEYRTRFRREAQLVARLTEPHIVPVHDWGELEGRLFLDTRLVRGFDLRTLLRERGALSPIRAVGIVEQVAAALDAAHTVGLVHRDVEPADILVTDVDFAYLADFGTAHVASDSAVTQVGITPATYTYMAPECFDTGPLTARADIYSLTCVLYECLTGAPPFPPTGTSVLIRAHLSEPPPRPSTQRTGIPAAFDEVIAQGMAKNPEDRYATAGALARAARVALTGPRAASARPTGPSARPTGVAGAPTTGGFPTLVIKMPDGAGDGSAESAERVLPAIIPSDPTEIRPSDTQLVPLPPAEPDPRTAGAPVRPFPDAHLYRDEQVHPAALSDGDPALAPYPPDDPTRVHGTGYPLGPTTGGFPASPTPNLAPPHPASGREGSGLSAPDTPAPGQLLGPPTDGSPTRSRSALRGRRVRSEPPEPRPDHGVAVPILVGIMVVAVVAIVAVLGFQLLGSTEPSAAPAGVAVRSAAPTGPSTAPSTSIAPRSTTPTSSTTTTPAALPAGAQPCPRTGSDTRSRSDTRGLDRSATGTSVTSCGFAEEVRKAYLASAGAGATDGTSVTVTATSPVTGRSYTMTCTAEKGLVTCSGGENAVVYVY
ncbi:serine/threonine-protein kinase [Nocardia paucivorans]|uniref:serine/threonine-protein kinase n=1 Tax=Nocardia paucivorans TaxID=114259 RepID=UPI000594BE7F|nr:serine/threonine-protein kinase [Nocardia paucivorans]